MIQTLHIVPEYNEELIYPAICKSMEALNIAADLRPEMKIVIKPNLVMAKSPDFPATTHPLVIKAVIRWLREQGMQHITIEESSGGLYNAEAMKHVYHVCGMDTLGEGAELNMDFSAQTVNCPAGFKNHSFHLITPIVEADYIINICKLKTHAMTGYSGGIKNLFGTIPGLEKPQMHYRWPEIEDFSNMLLELAQTVTPQLTVIDAIDAMEGNGPTGGKPRLVGSLAASRDPFALDMVCASLVHQNPVHVPYLRAGMKRGVCPESLDELSLWGVPVQSLAVSDFIQPESCSVNFLDWLPKFLRPLAEKVATPVPKIQTNHCVGCGKCAESCPQHTIRIAGGHAMIDYRKCIRCYCCHEMCPKHVIDIKRFRLFRF